MAFAHWELHSYLCVVLGWVFAPFYLRSGVFTTPEFLEKRYTPATRTVLSLIFMVSYVLTKASVTIYAGAIAISTILGYQPERRSICRCWGPPTTSGSRPSRWSSSPGPTP